MKILVTGAGGFIGTRLVSQLLEKGHQVRCLANSTRSKEKLLKLGVDVVEGDITSLDSISNLFNGIDWVYHMAANAHPSVIKPFKIYHSVNVVGTRNVLDGCVKAGVKKVLVMSSIAATGPSKDGQPLNEKSPLEYITNYGKSKKIVEEMVRDYNNKTNLETVIIRPPFVYGIGDKDWLSLFLMIKSYKSSLLGFPIPGKHLNKIDFCYVDNLVDGLIKAMESKQTNGKTYFLSDNRSYQIKEIIQAVSKYYGKAYPDKTWPVWLSYTVAGILEFFARTFRFDPPLAIKDVNWMTKSYWVCDASLAKKEFGFSPVVNLNDGIRMTLDAYENKAN